MTRDRDSITLDEAKARIAITPKQAFRLLSLSKNPGYAAITRGDLPSYTCGGRILIPVQALLDTLEKGSRP